MLDYLPSVVACCAIYVARKNMGRTCWSLTLEKYTKYHAEDLMPCLMEVRAACSAVLVCVASCLSGVVCLSECCSGMLRFGGCGRAAAAR